MIPAFKFYFSSSYVWLDPVNNVLTPQKVFVCISLFNLLRIPLTLFPMVIKECIQMLVSLRRITAFLNADEMKMEGIQEKLCQNNVEKMALEITNGTFTWENPKFPQLRNLNLAIPHGSLTAIVGVVGSGKSSLLQGKKNPIKLFFICFLKHLNF